MPESINNNKRLVPVKARKGNTFEMNGASFKTKKIHTIFSYIFKKRKRMADNLQGEDTCCRIPHPQLALAGRPWPLVIPNDALRLPGQHREWPRRQPQEWMMLGAPILRHMRRGCSSGQPQSKERGSLSEESHLLLLLPVFKFPHNQNFIGWTISIADGAVFPQDSNFFPYDFPFSNVWSFFAC